MEKPILRLPDFIVIGAQKCGTSSLHKYLEAHPDLFLSQPKELQFFAVDEIWQRGVDWYAGKFESNALICGEASPQYTWQPWVTDVPKRIYSVIPKVKLIYLVRDPINRIFSQYVDFVHQSKEQKSPEELLSSLLQSSNKYVEPSRYYYQIEKYLEFFPPEQLRVWTMEDLEADPNRIMRQILNYLGVDSNFTSPVWTSVQNPQAGRRRPHALFRKLMKKGGRPDRLVRENFPAPLHEPLIRLLHYTGSPIVKPTLSPDQERILMDLFRDDVRRLRNYAQNSFSNWRPY